MTLPVIGLMLGDAAGIGPEICARVLASRTAGDVARIVVVGDARVLERGIRDARVQLDYRRYERIEDVEWTATGAPLVDLRNLDPAAVPHGRLSEASGRACGETLKTMIEEALAGRLDAICFAPLNKAALHGGGWKYPDEHQMFARLTGQTGFFGEMNVIPEFSTFRVTSHVPLREVAGLITPERIHDAVRLAHRTMRGMGHAAPRIAVAALNPHAGEHGLFGDEEIAIIRPALERLRAEGIETTGPLPSDTVFLRARRGEFDAVVIMYHVQGQIATKLLGF
jgi:4-hydroxythreonine-4-phosphate dehydrogenase